MSEQLSDPVKTVLDRVRVGCLGTVGESGIPHLVPFCFALSEGFVYSSVDEKPQRSSADELGRVQNIRKTGRATLMVHHYEEDWTRLGWVQVRGPARVLAPGNPGHSSGVVSLRDKYPQYRNQDLENRPVIKLTPQAVVQWGELDRIPDR